MKCKKPDCNGVVEDGVCIKCGATSIDTPVKSKEKAPGDGIGKEPSTASSKASPQPESKPAVHEKPKEGHAKKDETVSKDKPAEKAPAKSEIEQSVKTEKSSAPSAAIAASSESKQLQALAKTKIPADSPSAVKKPEAKKPADGVAENVGKAPPDHATKAQTSKLVEESKSAKAEKKEPPVAKHEVAKEAAPAAAKQEKSTTAAAAAQPEKKQVNKQEAGSNTSESDDSAHRIGVTPPPETPQMMPSLSVLAKRKVDPSEGNPDIEPTIPLRTVEPEGIEQTLNLRTVNLEDTAAYRNIIHTVKSMLEPREVAPSREDLLLASRALRHVMPYNFDAWRLHADLLLTAIHQLETRQLMPDPNFTLMAIPLREDDLRDAAEQALRECAHFADSEKLKIKLIDEANQIRRLTWF